MADAIAVQGAIGGIGEKPVTLLHNFGFNSMARVGGFYFGTSGDGLFLLNGTNDNDDVFTSNFTLATSDFGIHNPKRLRFITIGIYGAGRFTIEATIDDQEAVSYHHDLPKAGGLQRVRIPIRRTQEGRYWKLKFSSENYFRIDEIKALIVTVNNGKVGY